MAKIKHWITNKSKTDIIIFDYCKEFYRELDSQGLLKKMKETPQLGLIKVDKIYLKYKYDYTMLQIYLHGLVQSKINEELEYSYNNIFNFEEFIDDSSVLKSGSNEKATFGDLIRILILVSNLGHTNNTFTSSKACLMKAKENKVFADTLIQSSENTRFQNLAKKYIKDTNYKRLHLLNAILALETCNQDLDSVIIGQELIYAYMEKDLEDDNKESKKLNYLFSIFQKVRNLAYIAYDLKIADISIGIDLDDKNSLINLLRETLSAYNNPKETENLLKSIAKLLDDQIYNKEQTTILHHQISKKMVRDLENYQNISYYDLWLDKNSPLNKIYSRTKSFVPEPILKLTFCPEEEAIAKKLIDRLDRTNNIRMGYYDRYHGSKTIVLALAKGCKNKLSTAHRLLRIVISHLRSIENIEAGDVRYLLVTKFFLYYLLGENEVFLEPTIDSEVCVICSQGSIQPIKDIDVFLNKGLGNGDQRHEIDFLKENLKQDKKTDTSIAIISSIKVRGYKDNKKEVRRKNNKKEDICEFDGMIIHPNRKSGQIVFLEAKNTRIGSSEGKKDLKKKLRGLNIEFDKKDILVSNKVGINDASLIYSF